MHPSASVNGASDWLAAAPDVVARLEAARHARVADIACGRGLSTVALAHMFLDAHVDGLDGDTESIADARRLARDAGLDGRVRFVRAHAAELTGPYDLIVIRAALPDPLPALAAAHAALAASGALLVASGERAVDAAALQAGFSRVEALAAQISRLHP